MYSNARNLIVLPKTSQPKALGVTSLKSFRSNFYS